MYTKHIKFGNTRGREQAAKSECMFKKLASGVVYRRKKVQIGINYNLHFTVSLE